MSVLKCTICKKTFESPIGNKSVEAICSDCLRSFVPHITPINVNDSDENIDIEE